MNNNKSKESRTTNKVGLFCNARNEKNIKEWAAHHLLIGFDYITIFDHKSDLPLKDIFKKFDKRVSTIRINIDGGNLKQKFMTFAVQIAKSLNLDWFIYLDADEFLILNDKFMGVKHFLNYYKEADSLGINWLFFGSNNFISDPSGLILEKYTKSSIKLDQHVKSFVRPNEIKFTDNPHFYHMKNPLRMLGTNFKILNSPKCFNKVDIHFEKANAYIAHYIYQSEETYKKRKVDLKADDGTNRCDIGKDIHKFYNEIENIQPQKYVNQIKNFLSYFD
jgi:hypothetical protein